MTEKFQYKLRYQVYADGYRSQSDDLGTAKIRADYYRSLGLKDVSVHENNENGRFTVYKPKA